MNKNNEHKINKFFDDLPKDTQCIQYVINITKSILNNLERDEARNSVVETLLNFFDSDESPFGNNFDEIYAMPTNIKKIIRELSLASFENIDNDVDTYVASVVIINNFTVKTYSDYKRSGIKTGGVLNITIAFDDNILTFCNQYNFIPEKFNNVSLNKIYQNIKNDETQCKILSKMQKKSRMRKSEFKGFFKLLCCIPKIFNGYVY
jgi:hypothetical protein